MKNFRFLNLTTRTLAIAASLSLIDPARAIDDDDKKNETVDFQPSGRVQKRRSRNPPIPPAPENPVVAPEAPEPPEEPEPPLPKAGGKGKRKSADTFRVEINGTDIPIREALEIARQELDHAQSLARVELSKARDAIQRSHFPEKLFNFDVSRDEPRVSVLPNLSVNAADGPQLSDAQINDLHEDLKVMSKIFLKAAHPKTGREDFFSRFSEPNTSNLDAQYFPGVGVLFFVTVDFPLAEESSVKPEQKEPLKRDDDVWEETRRHLRGEDEAQIDETSEDNPKPFDSDKVDRLTDRLVDSLRHAKNIRHLKSEEPIQVLVRSRQSAKSGFAAILGKRQNSKSADGNSRMISTTQNRKHAAILLAIKKRDVDAANREDANAKLPVVKQVRYID